jgi:regulator of sigma E protease
LSLVFVALNWIWVISVVAIALGCVIFVHELGHFLVAKLCGVKVEKFYLGFDIAGWKLFKFRYGETEYGIGVFPVGGYVKMLGQEDNPNRLRAEIERAKLQQPAQDAQTEGSSSAQSKADAAHEPAEDVDLAQAEAALYDPRSYLAKSVPKRMAIISAGVIMNVIFAFFTAMGAYYFGVEQLACAVGDMAPGEAAWRAGIRPGDRVVDIAGYETEQFLDFQRHVTVGDIENGVTMLVNRPGVKEPIKFKLQPDILRGFPTIGVTPPYITSLVKGLPQDFSPFFPESAASLAKPALKQGDRVVSVNGVPVKNYVELLAQLVKNPEQHLQLTVECTVPADGQKSGALETTKLVDVAVPPQPMRTLGLVMAMGDVTAIEHGSPADTAGIKPNDRIIKIDGKPVDDPMFLPQQLRRRAGESITVTVERKDSGPVDITVALRLVDWYEEPIRKNNPLSIPELGVAYQVLNTVVRVVPGSPAEKADIKPCEIIKSATILRPELKDPDVIITQPKKVTLEFDEKNPNWPFFFYVLQGEEGIPFKVHPDSPVQLTLNNDRTVILNSEIAPGWFNPNRGFIFDYDTFIVQAHSFGGAVVLGAKETGDALTLVVRILRKLGSQISLEKLSGPISIAATAGQAAQHGPATLLLFLTLLSANLAVLNLLPIPILDGGHLVFLAYEGIRGKPADERVQIGLSMLGLIFLLSLMLFVTGMDIIHLFFE